MSTRAEYKHLLLHCSVLQHCIGSLYEKNPSPKRDVLIQSIARELQQVSATCCASPFDKTISEPIFGPSALFRFPSVSPSLSLSPPVPVLVLPAVFSPNASEPLFLPDNNLLVVPSFISSPSLFCSNFGELFLYYSCSFLLIPIFPYFSSPVGCCPHATAFSAQYLGAFWQSRSAIVPYSPGVSTYCLSLQN